jgi:hypothetical protein
MFETKGTVQVENYIFPQFTNKKKINSTFHMFQKCQEDTYDVIIGRDILLEIGITLCYNTVKSIWDKIKVDMVPRGHWTRKNIDSFWKQLRQSKEEANAAIRKAECKIADIEEIAESREHLSLGEKNKFKAMLQNHLPFIQRNTRLFHRRTNYP